MDERAKPGCGCPALTKQCKYDNRIAPAAYPESGEFHGLEGSGLADIDPGQALPVHLTSIRRARYSHDAPGAPYPDRPI